MLTLQNLSYTYPKGRRPAVNGLNLKLEAGGIYGLLGANGTGKSTLLYLICGLLRPQAGTVTVMGQDPWRRLPSTLSEIFLIPEEIYMPAVTLAQFVEQNAPLYPRFSAEEMASYLAHFRLTADIHLGRLSMGQRKKALIAFALACNTRLLLMDEPTNGLDIPGKAEFRRAIVSAMSPDRAIVISTHQVRDLDRVLDHVVILSDEGIMLSAPISRLQQKLCFEFVAGSAAQCEGALWCEAVPGGYSAIRLRQEGEEETDVNLESLFEFTFRHPGMLNEII